MNAKALIGLDGSYDLLKRTFEKLNHWQMIKHQTEIALKQVN